MIRRSSSLVGLKLNEFVQYGTLCYLLITMALGCTSQNSTEVDNVPTVVTRTTPINTYELPVVPDNVVHDTLLVQVTFDLQDGTYIMVASNVVEKFEGLRIYHYSSGADSSANILAVSPPGYDSWSMLPKFFGPGKGMNGSWMTANFGERQSWGQKLFWCNNDFQERGFLDVAYPEHVTEGDSSFVKRTDIARYIRLSDHADTTIFNFDCDSVYVYDDLRSHTDIIVPAVHIHYAYHPKTGLVLWLNGTPRIPATNV